MKELFWKKMSLLSVRLIWKMSLQMLSRLFPLTHSWRKKKKKNNLLYLYSPVPWMPWIAPPVTPSPNPHLNLSSTPTQTHRWLTSRQSLAMCRLSCADLRSMRRNRARRIPDLLLQRRLSMSASAKVQWRRWHRSHRCSTEMLLLPGIIG